MSCCCKGTWPQGGGGNGGGDCECCCQDIPLREMWNEVPTRGADPNWYDAPGFPNFWNNHHLNTAAGFGSSILFTVRPPGPNCWTGIVLSCQIWFFQVEADNPNGGGPPPLDTWSFKLFGEFFGDGDVLDKPSGSVATSSKATNAYDTLFVTPKKNVTIDAGTKTADSIINLRLQVDSDIKPNMARLHKIEICFPKEDPEE